MTSSSTLSDRVSRAPFSFARRKTQRAAGFSLVEVMMAMLVLVMIVFSLTYILVNSLADTAYARQRSEASVLANQAIEEIRSLPWSRRYRHTSRRLLAP